MSHRVESNEMLINEINKLISDGLISDERFAESYFQSRKRKGFGPLRIKNELAQRGINDSIFYSIQPETDWSYLAFQALEKKQLMNSGIKQKGFMCQAKKLNQRYIQNKLRLM